MSKNRRTRCTYCGSFDLRKNGQKDNKQRYYCKSCAKYFTNTRKDISSGNRIVWFRQWVEYGHTIGYISKCSRYSERTLKRYFYEYLSRYPRWRIWASEKVNLLIDGTYFANKVCLVLYQDSNLKATQFYRLTDGEWLAELKEDISNLLSLGIRIESVTCDGARSIIRAVKDCSPDTVIQRCTVHIQRKTLLWLTRNPKSDAGRELRTISCKLSSVTNREQWGYWLVSLIRWEEKHRAYLNQKSYADDPNKYWFTHRMVRKSFTHIKRALPNLFHYLDNPDIPKSTNALEPFFGHLKTNLRQHRGLSKEHLKTILSGTSSSKTTKISTKKSSICYSFYLINQSILASLPHFELVEKSPEK